VSSEFADDFDDAIRSLKMETDVNEVCLVEADALVARLEARGLPPTFATGQNAGGLVMPPFSAGEHPILRLI
jgi:hypothetical protein